MPDTAAPLSSKRLHGPHYPLGVVLVAGSGICFSFVGLTMRHVEAADGWQILFYRSIAAAIVITLFMLIRDGARVAARFRRIGRPGVLYAAFMAFQFSCYVFAIINTSVANTVFILSASPLFAALFGWIFLRERVTAVTSVAIGVVIAGVALMIGGGIGGGTWLGDLIALGLPVAYALAFVVLRRSGETDMIPAAFLANILCALFAAAMVSSFVISMHDLLLSLLMGAAMISAAIILLTLGGRHVPVAEVALLVMTETLFAPLWVWLFIGETPPPTSLIGGALVLVAVAGQAIFGLRATSPASR